MRKLTAVYSCKALLQEQRAQFAEWGLLGSADDGQVEHDQGESEDSNT